VFIVGVYRRGLSSGFIVGVHRRRLDAVFGRRQQLFKVNDFVSFVSFVVKILAALKSAGTSRPEYFSPLRTQRTQRTQRLGIDYSRLTTLCPSWFSLSRAFRILQTARSQISCALHLTKIRNSVDQPAMSLSNGGGQPSRVIEQDRGQLATGLLSA
jgi:hypothetical protein